MDSQTHYALEFEKVTTYLTQFTYSPLGASHIETLQAIADAPQIERWLTEVSELKEIREVYGVPPIGGTRDIRDPLSRVRIEGMTLTPLEFRHIYETIRTGRATKKFMAEIEAPRYPHIRQKIEQIEVVGAVEAAIHRTVDEEGEILDGASPTLKHIRRELRQVRDKIQTWLQNFLQRSNYQSVIQDHVITNRSNRYVIPIKAASQGKVKGIVHDQSSSGATVFIEPLATVEMNNKVASLEAEEKAEIYRILLELTDLVRQHHEPLARLVAMLGELDFINAKARLSQTWRCAQPKLNHRRGIHLMQARHPLLLLQHEHAPERVVPIDIRLDEPYTTLLITGPNTGGKTVSLKTLGLLVLMNQAGLHIPVNPDSEMGIFEKIYADIGDQQSIEQSLSTFSSHIRHIVDILDEADDQTLVLLDELGAGTDPAEGASLGVAILEHLDSIQATCVATTHHDALKSYAYTHPRTVNACVEFDVDTLSPTYRLLFGMPGKSNAYIIAEKLGLPEALITRARTLMGEDLLKVDHLIQKLTHENEHIEQRKAEIDARHRGVLRLEKETDRLVEEAEQERQRIVENALEEAKDIVDAALRQSQDILGKLPEFTRKEGKELVKTLHQEAQNIRKKIKRQQTPRAKPDSAPVAELVEGATVKLSGFGQTGTVLNISKDEKHAEVQVGAMRIEMPLQQLTPISTSEKQSKRPQVSIQEHHQMSHHDHFVRPELMLVGKRVDEALDEVDKYLDQAFLTGLSSVEIVHGLGTGALKSAVAKLLRSHPHVLQYAPAEHNQGVTCVTLKRS